MSKIKKEVLEQIHENPGITAKEIAEKLDHDPYSIKRVATHYHRTGLLSRDGKGIKGSAYKYRLTKSGEARLRFFKNSNFIQ